MNEIYENILHIKIGTTYFPEMGRSSHLTSYCNGVNLMVYNVHDEYHFQYRLFDIGNELETRGIIQWNVI